MMPATAITDAIATLAEAERRFHLNRTEEEEFFPEWYADLPHFQFGRHCRKLSPI